MKYAIQLLWCLAFHANHYYSNKVDKGIHCKKCND